MRCEAAIWGGLGGTLALAIACGDVDVIEKGPGYSNGYGNVTVDGTDSQAHVLPPVGYECYPHYFVSDGSVYDVHGHYYKEHDGHWSILRSAPSVVRYQKPKVRSEPPCVGPSP